MNSTFGKASGQSFAAFAGFLLLAVGVSFSGHAQTHLDAAVRGGGSGGAVSLGGNDGSVSYSIPISLPAARGRYQPSVALSYNSNGGPGPFGVGWSLTSSYLEWSPRASPSPMGTDRNQVWLTLGGARQLMVPDPTSSGKYRPAVSSSFLSLQMQIADWNAPTGFDYAVVTDGVGNQYEFKPVVPGRRWHLKTVTDVDGNQTSFNYATLPAHQNQLAISQQTGLLTEIDYNYFNSGTANTATTQGSAQFAHRVLFDYATPSDLQHVANEAGSLFVYERLLTRIAVQRRDSTTTAFSTLSALVLTYGASPDSGRSKLTSACTAGRNRLIPSSSGDILACTTFDYQQKPSGGSAYALGAGTAIATVSAPSAFLTSGGVIAATNCNRWFPGVNGSFGSFLDGGCRLEDSAALIDLDGDHLPDLVWSGTSTLWWARNTTQPSNRPGAGNPIISFGTVEEVPGSAGWPGLISSAHPTGEQTTSGAGGRVGVSRLMDVNGDGRPDLVYADYNSCADGLVVTLGLAGSGASFGSPACMHGPAFCSNNCTASQILWQTTYHTVSESDDNGATTTDLLDFNGDGLADVVIVNRDSGVWTVFPGYITAAGALAFSANTLTFTPNRQQPAAIRVVDPTTGSTTADLVDLNGDGLPDRVIAIDGGSWYVEYNTGLVRPGQGAFQLPGTISVGVPISEAVGGPVDGENSAQYSSMLTDLDRDGSPDLLQIIGQSADCWFTVGRNLQSQGFASPACLARPRCSDGTECSGATSDLMPYSAIKASHPTPVGQHSALSGYSAAFVDLDGDGQADYLVHVAGSAGWTWYRGGAANSGTLPGSVRQWDPPLDTLVGVSSGGLHTDFVYQPSTQFDLHPGASLRPVLLASTTGGFGVPARSVTFSYGGQAVVAAWDDPARLEQLGFSDIYSSDSATNFVSHQRYSASTPALAGTILFSETGFGSGATGVPFGLSQVFSTATHVPMARHIGSGDTCYTEGSSALNIPTTGTSAYPVVLFDSQSTNSATEGTLTKSSVRSVACGDVDNWANTLAVAMRPDIDDSTLDTVSWATYATTDYLEYSSQCKSCLVESGTNAGSVAGSPGARVGKQLSGRQYYYDAPVGTFAGQALKIMSDEHLNYTKELWSDTYADAETPSRVAYAANGNVLRVRRDYPNQCSPVVLTTFDYDPYQLTPILETVGDSTSVLATKSFLDPTTGAVIARTSPYRRGVENEPTVLNTTAAFLFDDFGRMTGVGRRLGPSVSGAFLASPTTLYEPIEVFQYTLPTATTPGMTQTWRYATSQSYTLSTIPGATADISTSIAYFDGAGRRTQTSSQLGQAGTPDASSNISTILTGWLITGTTQYDAAGRVTQVVGPYYSSSGAPQNGQLAAADGTMTAAAFYDPKGRITCSKETTLRGHAAAPLAQEGTCASSDAAVDYVRSTKTEYGLASPAAPTAPDNKTYFTVATGPTWLTTTLPAVSYLDASGAAVWTVESDRATWHQIKRDLLNGVVANVTKTPTAVQSHLSYFDKRGRVVRQEDDTGEYVASGTPLVAQRRKYFTYLPGGDLATATTAPAGAGIGVKFVYGSLGRLRARLDVGSALPGSAFMRYDTAPPGTGFANAPGRLTQAYTCSGVLDCVSGASTMQGTSLTMQEFAYNADGVLTLKNAWWDDSNLGGYAVSRSVGNDGRELTTQVTGPSGSALGSSGITVKTWYDSVGRPVRLTHENGAPTPPVLWTATSGYDAQGRITEARMDDDHLQTAAAFSPVSGLLTELKSLRRPTPTSGSMAADFSDGHDDLHHAMDFSYQGTLLTGFTDDVAKTKFTSTYDVNGRLQTAKAEHTVGTPTLAVLQQQYYQTYGFAVDGASSSSGTLWNLTSVTTGLVQGDTNTESLSYKYDSGVPEQLTSIQHMKNSTSTPGDTVVTDSDGRGLVTQATFANDTGSGAGLLQAGAVQLGYDAAMRLVTISRGAGSPTLEETLSYDAAGGLAKRALPGKSENRFYLDAAVTVVKNTSDGTTRAWVHVSAGGERVVSMSPRGDAGNTVAMLYYHRDRLGSVVATTAQGGADGAWYRYDPYGNPAGSYIGSAAVAADVESELGYTGGVRLSEGLLHLEARAYWSRLRRFVQPDNVDERRYSYVGGDPANGVDPTGHMVETRGPPVTIIVGKPDGGEIVTTVPTGGGGDGGAPSSPGGGEGVPTVTPTTPGSGVADNSSANQQAANAAIPGRGPQGERAQGPGGVGGGGASGSQRRRVQPLLSQSSSPALKSFEDHLKKCGPDMRDCIYGSAAGSPGPVVAAIAGANIVRLGQLGEATIRRYLYIGEKIATRVSGRLRIPDGINLLDSTLNEVKNVQYLAYTQQLKDFATIAALKGLDFVLYVRDGATLSGPLWEKVASGEIRLIFY